jgi:hypothetical protein
VLYLMASQEVKAEAAIEAEYQAVLWRDLLG